MTKETLHKARTIHKSGGVERTAPTRYEVTSTSGETYFVELTLDRCTCPATGMCAHKASVELARSAKRKAVASRYPLGPGLHGPGPQRKEIQMYIEARLNNMHIRTSCVTCGASDKPGDVAYYDENNNWVCDTCVESGVEAMRANLHAEAERYRRLAGQYEETAEEEITIAPIRGEVLRERDQLDAWAAREKIRQQNAPDVDFGDVPF